MKKIAPILFSVFVLFSCTPDNPAQEDPGVQKDTTVTPVPPKPKADKYGVQYVFDDSVIPEIHVSVPLDEWNRLLDMYDANNKTKQYIHCDIKYKKGDELTELDNCGLRLKGQSSRRRPEGNPGEHHQSTLRRIHFALHFQKYIDNDKHSVHGCKSVRLKACGADPSYVRELFSYDLFHRVGVWTAINCTYCRLWIKIEGDAEETYMGVYDLEESINKRYLKERSEQFGGKTSGNLWKCRYYSKLNLSNATYGVDIGGDEEYVYEYKMDEVDFAAAKIQLRQFMLNLQKGDPAFHDWILEACDVELLMKTYAVNVAVAMWDDYWNNANNYYLYFDSKDQNKFKFYFIPYDYDISMGSTSDGQFQTDAVRQDPLHWGDDTNPLIRRILKFDDFRKIYTDTLLELVEEGGQMCEDVSVQRILEWQDKIREYIANDTGEHMEIQDLPAGWSSHQEYRLTEDCPDNFFRVKTESILQYCK